ncbi:hypothetical protein [Lentzea sp. HUAS12]|uniref:hypothetical protein n=1 Tax=Lentzea sp. HUAS12 TaxID=2951806 RepID=UPI0020A1AFE4|nr:hypothetical protein [Lentzea sp. HUAS12]USX53593.1 hypothetical protein ND450_05670 [Lentzea sp. HUAS12]
MAQMLRMAAALGSVLVVVTACAAGGQSAGSTQSANSGGDVVEQASVPACGDRIDTLPGRVEGLSVTGEFPPRTGRDGDGTFAGTVTVTSTGAEIAGVATPEADVYVARGGEVVATPVAKDSVGQVVDLRAGTGQVFTARGTIARCAGGGVLAAGRYEVFAVVVVNRDDGPQVVVAGGPWPLEVT